MMNLLMTGPVLSASVIFATLVMLMRHFIGFRENERRAADLAFRPQAIAPANPEPPGPDEMQVAHVNHFEMPDLVEKLPYGSWHESEFNHEDGQWHFRFDCNHVSGRFHAFTSGHTPREAFALAKHSIHQQLSQWRRDRFHAVEETLSAAIKSHLPKALIVDDDVDLASATQLALTQLGYQTEVITKYEDLHRKIAASDADYIFLDWKLNNQVTADQVVEKTVRLIDTFADLREKFQALRPRVITYSVLERGQVALPTIGGRYFTHYDHWQKPLQFHEIIERASGLLTTN